MFSDLGPLSFNYNFCARDCRYRVPASRARRMGRSLPQRDAITHQAYSAIHVVAALDIIDPIAVADIEPTLAAVLPDRVLNEPGKGPRKRRIELPGIDPLGDGFE